MSKYQKIDKIDGIYILQSYKKPLRTKIYDLEKENKTLRRALELAVHDLATYEWQGLGKFARSEEIIQAELIDQAKKETDND